MGTEQFATKWQKKKKKKVNKVLTPSTKTNSKQTTDINVKCKSIPGHSHKEVFNNQVTTRAGVALAPSHGLSQFLTLGGCNYPGFQSDFSPRNETSFFCFPSYLGLEC